MTRRPALVWRATLLRLVIAALPLWVTVAVLWFNVPVRMKLLVGSILVGSLVSPVHGLIAIAVLAPLGRLVAVAFNLYPIRFGEALVLAFVAGWLLRRREGHDGPRVPAALVWLTALMVCASLAGQIWRVAQVPGELGNLWGRIYQAYYLGPDRVGFEAGARILEGLALVAAAVTLVRGRPRLATALPVALTASAVVAASTSVLLARGIGFAQMVSDYRLTAPRLAPTIGDVNAAGSYFGMMLLVAVGMAWQRRSAVHYLWLIAAGVEGAALWLTGSRTAVAATAIVVASTVAFTAAARWPPAVRKRLFAVIVIAAVVAALGRAWMLRNDVGTDFRREFYATSGRMIASHPITGVGIGQYYAASPMFLSRFLGWFYGAENAHNYFLQVIAELGIPGAVPFLALIGFIVFRGGRALARNPQDTKLLGCWAGVIVFLITCLTGHPLLTDEVAFAFWIMAGLVIVRGWEAPASGSRAQIAADPEWHPPPQLVAATVVGVLVLFIGGARQPILPWTSPAVDGLGPWETAADGTRFRWTLDYAALFVPQKATRVYIPIRVPTDAPPVAPMGVQVRSARVDSGRVLVGREWTVLNLALPPIDSQQPYRRIALKVDRTWQPAVYLAGSSDMRHVGVQLGEIKLFYED